jgi:hypothetical protein
MVTANDWKGNWQVTSVDNSNLGPAASGRTSFTTDVTASQLSFTDGAAPWKAKTFTPGTSTGTVAQFSDSIDDSTDTHPFTLVLNTSISPKTLTCVLCPKLGAPDDPGGGWTATDTGPFPRRYHKRGYRRPQAAS